MSESLLLTPEQRQTAQVHIDSIYTQCQELFAIAAGKFPQLCREYEAMLTFGSGPYALSEGVTLNIPYPPSGEKARFEIRKPTGFYPSEQYEREVFMALLDEWPKNQAKPFGMMVLSFEKKAEQSSTVSTLAWDHLVRQRRIVDLVASLPRFLRTSVLRQLLGEVDDHFTQLTEHLVLGTPVAVTEIDFLGTPFPFQTKLAVLKTLNQKLLERPAQVGYWIDGEPPHYEVKQLAPNG